MDPKPFYSADIYSIELAILHLNWGDLYSQTNRPKEAEASFQKALLLVQEAMKLNPENGQIFYTLGVAQYRLKQFAPALENLQKSNTLYSKTKGKEHPVHLAFLAMTCHQLNKKPEAEIYFKKLQEAMKDKKNSEYQGYQGFFKEAEALLKK